MKSLPWDMIGAIFGGLSFLLTLLVEWHKLGTRQRIIIALIIGIVVFLVIYLIPPLLFPVPESAPTATFPVADPPATISPTEIGQGLTDIVTPNAPLYDDFESDTINSSKWGIPSWGNPQQYIPTQSQGKLRFEISKDWYDLAVKQHQPVMEMYVLITLESVHDGAFGISIGANPTRYNLMLRGDGQVATWNEIKELDSFDVSGICCPYTHLLGAKADGEQLHFYVDNKEITSYPLIGYPEYAGLQIVGLSQTIASVDNVWIKFKP